MAEDVPMRYQDVASGITRTAHPAPRILFNRLNVLFNVGVKVRESVQGENNFHTD